MNHWQRAFHLPSIPLGEDGKRVTASSDHRELSKQAAKEGMVLLKNEKGILPLTKGVKLALFGKASFDYVKGGGGSGDVTVSGVTNLYEGFKGLGDRVKIFEEVSSYYRDEVKKQYLEKAVPGMTREPELPDDLCKAARAFTDTAVISICRFSGEGWDRKTAMATDWQEKPESDSGLVPKTDPVFEDGDFYLTHAEKAMVEKVKQYFDRIIVVLNVGGMVDTGWFIKEEKIDGVLMAWQGGLEGGSAAAELLCGIGNPSGKLSDTFAKELSDYPSTYNFHESDNYVEYTDDIYMGYRYFETIPGAKEKVNYPFGYGLSYTNFEVMMTNVDELNTENNLCQQAKEYDVDHIRLAVQVTNTGAYAGKEVIQVYAGAPQGKLGKAAKVLVAFDKTRLLQPGETQKLILEFPVSVMASYDDSGKIQKAAWLLEEGEYKIYVGTSVRDVVLLDYRFIINQTIIIKQVENKLVPSQLKKRMLADGSFEELPTFEGNDPSDSPLPRTPREETDGFSPDTRGIKGFQLWDPKRRSQIHSFSEVAEGKIAIEEFLAQLSDEDLAHLLGGQPNTGVANTFGIGNLPDYGVPNIMTADGPAGLRIQKECGVFTTAFPCATLLACTWNRDIVFRVGEAGGKEVRENNIFIWLTPAVNLHRSPLCGRNFEYYSEDPYLSGILASCMVKGMQSQHVAASVKHFALNNKETNRRDSDSRVSERAARELYLKVFEIVVREADPWSIMTSYNIINGRRASENKELLEDILRKEWGFQGMVTTDWWNFGEHFIEVKAGNDVKMARGFSNSILKAKEAGIVSREEMERCAKRILELILKVDW